SSTAQAANALLNGYSNQDDEHEWQVVEIKPGQTLEQVFRQLGLSARLLHQVAEAARDDRDLARIRPGDQFAFNIDADTGFRHCAPSWTRPPGCLWSKPAKACKYEPSHATLTAALSRNRAL